MSETTAAQRFAEALQAFERDGDLEQFVGSAFTPDVQLLRPELDREYSGADGAREFWTVYRDQFDGIKSTFSRVVQQESLGVLEWESQGGRRTGDPIRYRGVSLLDLADDGRVRRFATYFDTAAFVRPAVARP